MGCTEQCWTPVKCPAHSHEMTPLGRSAPLEMYQCSYNYTRSQVNPRHLWNEHDSTRWYSDPAGRDDHLRVCEQCQEMEI